MQWFICLRSESVSCITCLMPRCPCRDRYQELITGLGIRPLKIRAGRNLQVQMPIPTEKQQQQFKKTGKVPKELVKGKAVNA